jgi:CHAD domain-containing protein
MRAPAPAGPVLALDFEPGPLREALLPIVEARALLPLVHLHARVGALSVLDEAQKTVVRVSLEETAVLASSPQPLRPRLRLAAVRGYEAELEALAGMLKSDLGFTPADQALVDEAVLAAGSTPGGVSARIEVRLDQGQRSDEAVIAVLKRLLEVIDANLEGAIADVDTEFLHDFRVAVRRTRAVQRELRSVFPPPDLAHFRGGFRWLQQTTGPLRDLDVYLLEFDAFRGMVPSDMRDDLEPLRQVLEQRRVAARADMVRALRSERAVRLRARWRRFLDDLPHLPQDDRPGALRPISALCGERVARVYRKMVKMGAAIGDDSPATDYHELRKKGKELRYLLELFAGPLYPGEIVKPMVRSLKGLQDVLGAQHDREVQLAMLRTVRDEVALRAGGVAAVMAMGVLVARLRDSERQARARFAERFAEFAGPHQRQLVKETFG